MVFLKHLVNHQIARKIAQEEETLNNQKKKPSPIPQKKPLCSSTIIKKNNNQLFTQEEYEEQKDEEYIYSTQLPKNQELENILKKYLPQQKLTSKDQEKAFQIIKNIEGNKICGECNKQSSYWVSLQLGNLICMNCAAIFRGIGNSRLIIRSISLDQLKREEIEILYNVGNKIAKYYWESQLKDDAKYQQETQDIKQFLKNKYEKKKYVNQFQDNEIGNFQENPVEIYKKNKFLFHKVVIYLKKIYEPELQKQIQNQDEKLQKKNHLIQKFKKQKQEKPDQVMVQQQQQQQQTQNLLDLDEFTGTENNKKQKDQENLIDLFDNLPVDFKENNIIQQEKPDQVMVQQQYQQQQTSNLFDLDVFTETENNRVQQQQSNEFLQDLEIIRNKKQKDNQWYYHFETYQYTNLQKQQNDTTDLFSDFI